MALDDKRYNKILLIQINYIKSIVDIKRREKNIYREKYWTDELSTTPGKPRTIIRLFSFIKDHY